MKEGQESGGFGWEAPTIYQTLSDVKGVSDVVSRIRAMIALAGQNAAMRSATLSVVQNKIPKREGMPDFRDFRSIGRAVYDFVVQNVHYVRDPHFVEQLQTPQATLAIRAGDCDDMTILGASMLMSVGIPVRIHVVGRQNAFTHIFFMFRDQFGTWIPFDATIRRFGVVSGGWRMEQIIPITPEDVNLGVVGSLIAGAIGGVANLVGNVVGAKTQTKTNEANVQIAQLQLEQEQARLQAAQLAAQTAAAQASQGLKIGTTTIPYWALGAGFVGIGTTLYLITKNRKE